MAEECVACGGIGEHLARALQDAGWQGRYIHRAVRELCLPHATVPQIKQATGLDAAHLAEAVREADPKGEKHFENSFGPISGAARHDPEP